MSSNPVSLEAFQMEFNADMNSSALNVFSLKLMVSFALQMLLLSLHTVLNMYKVFSESEDGATGMFG